MENPIDFADTNNNKDPNYFKKHASSIPSEQSYLIIPNKADLVNTEKEPNARVIFYGWNNLSEFENKNLHELR